MYVNLSIKTLSGLINGNNGIWSGLKFPSPFQVYARTNFIALVTKIFFGIFVKMFRIISIETKRFYNAKHFNFFNFLIKVFLFIFRLQSPLIIIHPNTFSLISFDHVVFFILLLFFISYFVIDLNFKTKYFVFQLSL